MQKVYCLNRCNPAVLNKDHKFLVYILNYIVFLVAHRFSIFRLKLLKTYWKRKNRWKSAINSNLSYGQKNKEKGWRYCKFTKENNGTGWEYQGVGRDIRISLTSLLAQGGGFLMKFINAVEILIIKDQYPRCSPKHQSYSKVAKFDWKRFFRQRKALFETRKRCVIYASKH